MGSSAGKVVGATLDLATGGMSGGAFYSIGSAYDARKQGKKERQRAKEQQEREEAVIARQREEALAARKEQVNALRERLGARGDSTRSSSGLAGIRGSIGGDKLG